MNDRETRDQCVACRDNVVVTAGAGTGKTTLLVDTVLSRVEGGLDLRRLLMLTFTEKAANEMRLRLRKELESREPTPRLRAALDALDRAEIGTIHGFCAHLLREFPVEAGLDPRFEVDEGSGSREVFEREWMRWLAVELGPETPRREAWLGVLEVATLWQLREIASGLCSFRVPDEALDPDRARERGREALRHLRGKVADQLDAMRERCDRQTNNLVRQMAQASAFLRGTGDSSFLEKDPSKDTRGWDDFAEAAAANLEARTLAKNVARLDEARAGAAAALLMPFAKRFREAYAAAGFVSFDGLLAKAHELLHSKTYPGIRARVRERYDFIAVDEFQDTDPAQCEIIVRLAGDEAGRLVKGRLFIVGDPKQSIYSFRGADIVAYARVKGRMLDQGAREFVLRTNFRSHAGLLDVVNEVFSRAIREREELQPKYEPIEAEPGRATPEEPAFQITLFERPDGRILSDESRRAEAEDIAKRLQARGAPWRDVAILFKALTDAHIYLEALRVHGVPYAVEGEKFFYGAPEVIDFANLLRAVADPNDSIALAGLLRSPMGALDDRALWELRSAGHLDMRATPADPKAARLFGTLRALREKSRTMPVADLIDEIFATTFVLELAAAGAGGEQAVANLAKLRQKARDLATPDLRVYLRHVAEAIRTMEEEGESPLADETHDAVRVMSIHKAKGLEFPVVVLPDLHREIQGRHDEPAVRYDWTNGILGLRLADRVDAGAIVLAAREARRRAEEDRRVPYVALTRARERMWLYGSSRFSKASVLGLLDASLDGAHLETREAGVMRAGRAAIDVRRAMWREPFRRPKKDEPVRGATQNWSALAAVWRRRDAEYEKALKSPRFVAPSRPREDDGERAPALDRAAAVGIACHRAMQHLDFRKPKPVFAPGVEAEEARAIVDAFLATPAFAELAKAEVVARELPFVHRRPDGSFVSGTIDLVYRAGGRLWVADYKSDRTERPEMHAEQGRAYVDAVERALGERPAGMRVIYLRSGNVVPL